MHSIDCKGQVAGDLSKKIVKHFKGKSPFYKINGGLFFTHDGHPEKVDTPERFCNVLYMSGIKLANISAFLARGVLDDFSLRVSVAYSGYCEFPFFATADGRGVNVKTKFDLMDADANTPHLNKFCSFFHGATETDQRLIMAAIMSPLIGHCVKPNWLIDSAETAGQGTGKTFFVEKIAKLYDGTNPAKLEDSKIMSKDITEVNRALAYGIETGHRIFLVDNVRGVINGNALASLTTSKDIQVRRLYANETTCVSWCGTLFFTGNGAHLENDQLRRFVRIRLRKPSEEERAKVTAYDIEQYIEEHRQTILSEICKRLEMAERGDLDGGKIRPDFKEFTELAFCAAGVVDDNSQFEKGEDTKKVGDILSQILQSAYNSLEVRKVVDNAGVSLEKCVVMVNGYAKYYSQELSKEYGKFAVNTKSFRERARDTGCGDSVFIHLSKVDGQLRNDSPNRDKFRAYNVLMFGKENITDQTPCILLDWDIYKGLFTAREDCVFYATRAALEDVDRGEND